MKKKDSILQSEGFQSVVASLLCIVAGVFIGFIVLLIIEPSGALESILNILKNFLTYKSGATQLKYLGNTIVKTAPLLMSGLSILFSYKVGLFNIGASGQFTMGACVALYGALALGLGWFPCLLLSILAGALWGAIAGALNAYRRVNEVIGGIMLNWIALYITNMVLSSVKNPSSPYTLELTGVNPKALLPSLGLGALFNNNKYVTIAVPLSIIITIIVMIILNKTKMGYELRAGGLSKTAAKYCGINGKRNVVLSLAISGGLAGCSAAFLYLTGYEQWSCTLASVPAMGFNGIAATFLGGLSPIGTIFSSFFIEHILQGGAYVDRTLYCSQISDLIAAIIIYLCGFVFFVKIIMKKAAKKKEEKVNAKGGEK